MPSLRLAAPARRACSSPTTTTIRCPTTTTAGSAGCTATGCRWGSTCCPAAAARVLEVGVGSGVLVPTLTARYREYTGTDLTLAPGLDGAGRARLRRRVPARRSAAGRSARGSLRRDRLLLGARAHRRRRAAPRAAWPARSRPAARWSAAIRWSARLMSRAFSIIGYKNIDDDHVSPPVKIAAALAEVLTPVARAAFPPAAPVPAALYQCTSWTKPA